MGKWYFLVDGDPQAGLEVDESGAPIVRKIKQDMGDRIIRCKYPIKFVICTGDLTENGYDAKKVLCWQNGEYNQVAVFLNDYLNKIESKGIRVYCCPGNHDEYVKRPYWHKPIYNFLKRKYKAQDGRYVIEMMGVTFVCMGKYPDKSALGWFRQQFSGTFKGTPMVIFYHYNTVTGEPYSDWWSEEEKEAFYQTIKDYNVLLIANGHWHATGKGMWHDIPVVRGSGRESCIVEMNGDQLEKIYFEEI